MLMVNIEIFEDRNFSEGRVCQDMFCFVIQIVNKFCIVCKTEEHIRTYKRGGKAIEI